MWATMATVVGLAPSPFAEREEHRMSKHEATGWTMFNASAEELAAAAHVNKIVIYRYFVNCFVC